MSTTTLLLRLILSSNNFFINISNLLQFISADLQSLSFSRSVHIKLLTKPPMTKTVVPVSPNSIVCFQNTAHPVNGIYHQRPGPSNNVSSQGKPSLLIHLRYFVFATHLCILYQWVWCLISNVRTNK